MKPNQIYFYRNRGQWDWDVSFDLTSWPGLWQSAISFLSKMRISAFVVMQNIFGAFRMWTYVDFQLATNTVHHSTKIKKWGLTFYRSEKIFALQEDGCGLRLEGKEYYWPLSFLAFQFNPKSGVVDQSTTRASYQMPIAGTECDCQAFLEMPVGHIDIETPWLRGRFTLLEASNKILASRFQ